MSSPHEFLFPFLIFLFSAVIAVPLFKKLGLASVLGYLVAGSLLGPFGLRLVKDSKSLMSIAEIGIVMLLFLIGLELKPSRLWTMRRHVFGAGALQVIVTATLLAFAVAALFGLDVRGSLLIGFGLSLSSTAFALQILAERNQVNTQFGRLAFSILLFQDLAAIPLLASVPFLSQDQNHTLEFGSRNVKAIGLVVLVIGVLPFVIRPLLRVVAGTRIRELFTALTLLLVLGLALLMDNAGLSMALGSFIGGILLSDSEYRHQLEADLEPFKGLLLGLFFMAIGMGINYGLLSDHLFSIVGLTIAMMVIKCGVAYLLGRQFGLGSQASRDLAFTIPQGGEFAFVIFAVAVSHTIFSSAQTDALNLIVALSMAATPIGNWINDRFLSRWKATDDPDYDQIPVEGHQVIVAGFGRFGQITGRVLRTLDIGFTALELDSEQVEVLRRFGNKVYYGDASRLDLLQSAGADRARFMVVCIDDVEASLRTVDVAQANFSHLTIFARARNRNHAHQLMDRGIRVIVRETLGSSLEMAETLLVALGYPTARAEATMKTFKQLDHELLVRQHKIYNDEQQLISASKEASAQLSELLRADKERPSVSSLTPPP